MLNLDYIDFDHGSRPIWRDMLCNGPFVGHDFGRRLRIASIVLCALAMQHDAHSMSLTNGVSFEITHRS